MSAVQNRAAPITAFCLHHKSLTNYGTRTPTAFQAYECSSVMAQSKLHADSTEHGRKCYFGGQEGACLGTQAVKPEQLEVITAFVGGRDIFAVASPSWEKPRLLRLLANDL